MYSGPTLGKTLYRKLPNFYRTTIQLSTLLDVEQPLGKNDYRMVLELLEFSPEQVRFWGSRCKRPTLEALQEWEGTVQDLAETLQECERLDCLSVLVQALLDTLREGQGKKTGTNILMQDTFPLSPVLLPTTLPVEELQSGYSNPQWSTPKSKQTPNDDVDDAITLSSFSLMGKDEVPPDCMQDQCTITTTACSYPGRLSSGSDGFVTSSMLKPKQDLELLLTSSFEVPTEIAITCLAPSYSRKTTEFICNLVASAIKCCQCISNSGDLTWMSNSTVYVNNFARLFLFILLIVDVITCILSMHHTPAYTLELLIASIPVLQSLYVDQNLPQYRELIRKVKEVEASMGLIRQHLGQGLGRSYSNESGVLRELDMRKAKLNHLKGQVLPLYSDIRICIICTLVMEMLLVFMTLSVGLMCYTGKELLVWAQDGFTSLALVLLFIDCVYNFVIVAVYYHDRTIETVIQRDRFRLNASISRQESDAI